MGQGCCLPAKDANADLRGSRSRIKRKNKDDKTQNTFKQKLEDPEFTVKRNDSLCMAAKEHTQNIIGSDDSANKDSEIDTNHLQSTATAAEVNPENFFSAGTFAVVEKVATIDDENLLRVRSDRYEPAHGQELEKQSVSFGVRSANLEGEDYEQDKQYYEEKVDANGNQCNFDLSIGDILEVRDKVPASPATLKVQPQEQYFE